jgi:hypothetical protein
MEQEQTWTLIFRFESEDGEHLVEVSERPDGIVAVRARGVVRGKGADLMLAFLRERAVTSGRKLRILFDNTHLTRVHPDARRASAAFALEDSPAERLATCGDNLALRALTNLYSVVSRVPVRSFGDEPSALRWLEGEER